MGRLRLALLQRVELFADCISFRPSEEARHAGTLCHGAMVVTWLGLAAGSKPTNESLLEMRTDVKDLGFARISTSMHGSR